MENFLRNNGLAIVVYIALLAAAYGDLTAKLTTIKQVQDDAQVLVGEFIELKSKVKHMDDEAIRTRAVLIKLDDLLDQLDKTLVRQEGALTTQAQSISALQKDMEIVKKAVVK